ncbi:MAG: nucleotidyltransferase [Bacteroidetes bacterium]|jgi:predicted nucleotidyltransferase|nr:nucleotidyltransferase [Bacteroidota bacterium]
MIALYGSWARDEERPDSDIDLLVVLRPAEDRPPLGLKWFALEQELSERLQRPVELVTDAALDPYLRPSIERDAVVLYDEE